MSRKGQTIEELLQFLVQNVPGFTRPEVGSNDYEIIAGDATDVAGVQSGSEPSHIKEFLVRSIKMDLRNILTPTQHRQTPSPLSFYPNQYSFVGFLGWGESLNTILTEDKRTLRRLGRTAEEVGTRLKQVLDAPPRGFKVQVFSSHPGGQDCPFGKLGAKQLPHSNRDYSIMRGRQGIVVPGLAWHLIAEHGFFEGKFTKYRVDPTQLVKILFS